ncbi:MAG: hypothetical protein ACSLE8_16765 [Rhodococcus sp. (in: high G+C Gram-positive bacteria)]|nr:hypothetical protein BJF84_05750 [Rhodococcus sp. CUA-806]
MAEVYAYVACFILACLAIFQLALVLGAPLGKYAWGGSREILSTKLRIGSVVSIFLYLVFSAIVLDKSGAASIFSNDKLVDAGVWTVTVYLFIGVVMNGISRSKYERAVMTPLALVLAVLFLLVALS